MALNLDSIVNALSNLGSELDRATATKPSGIDYRLSKNELDSLYESNEICGRIVDTVANDANREGFIVLASNEDDSEPLTEELKALNFYQKLKETHRQARLYGTAALLLIVDDGLPLDQPVNWTTIKTIKTIQVIGHTKITPLLYQDDIEKDCFNEPLLYTITGTTTSAIVHKDRVCVMHGRGLSAERLRDRGGLGQSVIEAAWEAVKSIATAYQSTESALHEFQYNVLKVQDMGALLAGPGGESKFMKRLQAINLGRSFLRTTVLDGNEDWQTVQTNFGGISQAFTILQQRLSTATNMPLTLIFGQSPQGFSNNDQTGMDYYYAFIRAEQEEKFRPCIEHVSRLLFAARGNEPEKWEVVFSPLQVTSDMQRAEMKLRNAQVDAIYLANGVFDPDDVRKRFAQAEYASEITVDDRNLDADLNLLRAELERAE